MSPSVLGVVLQALGVPGGGPVGIALGSGVGALLAFGIGAAGFGAVLRRYLE